MYDVQKHILLPAPHTWFRTQLCLHAVILDLLGIGGLNSTNLVYHALVSFDDRHKFLLPVHFTDRLPQ